MSTTLNALIEVIEKTMDEAIQSSSVSEHRRIYEHNPIVDISFLGLKILALLKKTATFETLKITENESNQLLDYQILTTTEQFHRDLFSLLGTIKNEDIIPYNFISKVEKQIEEWVPGAGAYFQQKRDLRKQIYGYDLLLFYENKTFLLSDEDLKSISKRNGNIPILIKNADGNIRIYGSSDGLNWKSTELDSEKLASLTFPNPTEEIVLRKLLDIDEIIFQEIQSKQGHASFNPTLLPQLVAVQYQAPQQLPNEGKFIELKEEIRKYVSKLELPKEYADLWEAKIRHILIAEAEAFCTACRESHYKKEDVDNLIASKQAILARKTFSKTELEARIFRLKTIIETGDVQHPSLFSSEYQELNTLHPLLKEEINVYGLMNKLLHQLNQHKAPLQDLLKDNKIFNGVVQLGIEEQKISPLAWGLHPQQNDPMEAQARRIVDKMLNRLLDVPSDYDVLLFYTPQDGVEETVLKQFSQQNKDVPILIKTNQGYGIYGRTAGSTAWKVTLLDSTVMTTLNFPTTEGGVIRLKKEHISKVIYGEIAFKQGHTPLSKTGDAHEQTLKALAQTSETLLNHPQLIGIEQRLELQYIINYLLLYGIHENLSIPRGAFSSFIEAVHQHANEIYVSSDKIIQWVNAVAAPYYAEELKKTSVPEGENPADYYPLLIEAAKQGDTKTLLRYLAPNYDKLRLNALFYEQEIELFVNEYMEEITKLYLYAQLQQLLQKKLEEGEEIEISPDAAFLKEVYLLQAKCQGQIATDLIFWAKEGWPFWSKAMICS